MKKQTEKTVLNVRGMSAESILDVLKFCARKGQNIQVQWTREGHTRKGVSDVITKQVNAFIRYGIDYANLSVVKNAIEAGERDEVGPLPWGEWRTGRVNMIIDHNGTEYLRFYPSSILGRTTKPVSRWFNNGKQTRKYYLRGSLLASEFRDSSPNCFTVKAQDMDSITAYGVRAK